MTGFEIYLKEQGGILVDGKEEQFSTYTNVQRTWLVGKEKLPVQIGLLRIENNNTIGIRYPITCRLPNESQYESTLTYMKQFILGFQLGDERIGLIIEQ